MSRWMRFVLIATTLTVGLAIGLLTASAGCSVLPSSAATPPPPAPPAPHVESDCRAACTLEGMELAGVELSRVGDDFGSGPRCLCAPVNR